jgi:MOSC domain-containing protein
MVESIWRYPVKSAQGESVARAWFGTDGPAGDRAMACLTADGIVVSAKNPRRWGRMLYVTASVVSVDGGEQVMICVPGGEPLRAGTPQADEAVSAWLGERVRLSSEVPPNARLHRLWPKEPGMIPEWARSAGRWHAGAGEHAAGLGV